ncbi:putative nicotinate-nucleotide adenylyltransferase [Kordiimonas sediminis]|uniref:Probable nicotinate-nucleotide adenylyltransferase n=1 Tax=Kordiimonas sediminis TaxID=1735581 RepID=A0A919AQN6_9PROT|nr:nicotinate (nicotinamide) nucleotide adenylyltransferase [Kordiimonas sediminis]GHF20442.1 putative nicotinate-nucleotide adenylyltransferase [Kordiimonas sediminis]
MHRKPSIPISIYSDAARWRGRTVGLYGGSFNPVHKGHFHIAHQALKRLELDAVWMMVSPGNPLKILDNMDMAPAQKRLSHTRETLRPTRRIQVTDIETRLGTHFTAETLRALKHAMPHTRFVWIMGADNMASFTRWKDWQGILKTVPIAIFDRPGYTIRGLSSRLTQMTRYHRTVPCNLARTTRRPAWSFLAIPRHKGSATMIRNRLGQLWIADHHERRIS